jgi:hypothetical protein
VCERCFQAKALYIERYGPLLDWQEEMLEDSHARPLGGRFWKVPVERRHQAETFRRRFLHMGREIFNQKRRERLLASATARKAEHGTQRSGSADEADGAGSGAPEDSRE